jgi:hypothetical protein
LVGIYRSFTTGNFEKGWPVQWFRPVIHTDISDLRKLVRDVFNRQQRTPVAQQLHRFQSLLGAPML